MKFLITIIDNRTLEEATYVEDYDSAALAEYMWADGNYSCDCNRALFLAQHGKADPDVECGDGAFSAKVQTEDMQLVHADGCFASTATELTDDRQTEQIPAVDDGAPNLTAR